MSNLFDEFLPDEPSSNDGQFETDEHRYLRESFRSLEEVIGIEIAYFDPDDPSVHTQILFNTAQEEAEQAGSELASTLMQTMLKRTGLDAPLTRNDPRHIVSRHYADGTRSVIFTVTRADESMVPVHYETKVDGTTPKIIDLISYDEARETVLEYRDLDEYRTKLIQKLHIGEQILIKLSAEDLKKFDATFDYIQNFKGFI
ncbi:MAG: hypothetical protein V4611_01110 [Patescibacteria group bacterium]